MKRRIHVRVAPDGAISVEAEGFRGKGCEAATKAIEDALGKTKNRTRKPQYWQQEAVSQNRQQLGGT